jgi:hypothetical protein
MLAVISELPVYGLDMERMLPPRSLPGLLQHEKLLLLLFIQGTLYS